MSEGEWRQNDAPWHSPALADLSITRLILHIVCAQPRNHCSPYGVYGIDPDYNNFTQTQVTTITETNYIINLYLDVINQRNIYW